MKQIQTFLVVAGISLSSPIAMAQTARPFLTLSAAKAGAAACEAYAVQNNLRMAISIKDRGGNQVYFLRMDDVYQKQVEIADIKAEAASTSPLSTARIGQLAQPGTALAGLVHIPGLSSIEGGEPITIKTEYSIGGVGVSGASPTQDGNCAKAAVAAIIKLYE
jgi:glc operon protein GlcG